MLPSMTPAQMLSTIQGLQMALEERGIQKDVISTTNVNGIQLVRQDLSEVLSMQVPVETPVRNMLKRYPGNGNAHSFYRLEPTNTYAGKFLGTDPLNGFFPKGGLPNAATPNFKLIAIPYANLGDIAAVTFQDQAQGKSYTDLRAQQLRLKMLNVAMMEEWAIINGDSDTTSGLVWDGLYKQITTQGGQILVSGDGKFTAGGVRQLQFAQWEAGGQPNMLIMDGFGRQVLTVDLVQTLFGIRQNGGAMSDVAAGISFKAYDFGFGPTDWVASRYINPTSYTGQSFALSIDSQSMDGKNAEGNVICMVDADPMHTVDLAIVRTAWPTLVYETSALQVSCPAFQGIMTGLSYAGQTPFTSLV